jgi:hypothetical protein
MSDGGTASERWKTMASTRKAARAAAMHRPASTQVTTLGRRHLPLVAARSTVVAERSAAAMRPAIAQPENSTPPPCPTAAAGESSVAEWKATKLNARYSA